MAFIPYSYDVGHPAPWEYPPVAGGLALNVGDALAFNDSGLLVKATGATAPAYVAMTVRESTDEGEAIPAVRVDSSILFATPWGVANASPVPGSKYTIHTDGASITATTGGAAALVRYDGTAEGDMAFVRF